MPFLAWAITLDRKIVHKINLAEMCMLRWMCGYTRKDRLRNKIIIKKV